MFRYQSGLDMQPVMRNVNTYPKPTEEEVENSRS